MKFLPSLGTYLSEPAPLALSGDAISLPIEIPRTGRLPQRIENKARRLLDRRL
ncbi:hypothetical protein [uncultured Campylobacter sp.]|uniref:hypothetical protein n=1 Tax=uncultured Campylobacter sp. TaxID=218934 RepID=UPI0026348F1A|nr:hypothetical protein [uncultured Campylobacter sp.]